MRRADRPSISSPRVFVLLCVSVILICGGITEAALWDLSADWSDTLNPNGVWSYYVKGALGVSGTRTGDSFADPPGAPDIWGNSDSTYEGWSKSNGSESFQTAGELLTGDVYGHTGGVLEIRWTSPLAGPVHITGGVWAVREIQRSNSWQLTVEDVPETGGIVGDGDTFSRADPAIIDLYRSVDIGDVVAFTASPLGTGDYIAVNLSINPVPIPGAALLGALGLSVAGWRLRRRTV